MTNSYWWCPHCKVEVDPRNVTYQELHDSCGHPAEWITVEEAKTIAALRALLRRHVIGERTSYWTGEPSKICNECGETWYIGDPQRHKPGCEYARAMGVRRG